MGTVHDAGGAATVWIQLSGAEDQGGRCQQAGQDPDGRQGPVHVAAGSQLRTGQRVDNGQVAVEAQAGQAEDAGVHVEEHHVAAYLAERHAKQPVVALRRVHGPQGQGHHEGQVSQSQGADVDVRSPALGLCSPYGEDDHAIP
uniref:Uncharacterized protein n=1 Tax=Denticeps clupeoides TaxID=299321 RepID=A0AAY4A6Y1_9TELE